MNVSELKVMKSAAGYYIGRSYYDTETGLDLPYSRDSGYYQTKGEANIALPHVQKEIDDLPFLG